MVWIFYCVINIFCVITLALILFYVSDGQMTQRLFKLGIIVTTLFFASDLCYGLMASEYILSSINGNRIINAVYFSLSGIASFIWFLYSETIQSNIISKRKSIYLYMIPMLLLVIISFASCKTGWLFYIDRENVYHRGDFYFLQPVLAYGYIIATSIRAYIRAAKKENFLDMKKYLTLTSFFIFPSIALVFQIFLKGVPILCLGITLAIMQVYINSREQLISIDPLTHLNNRNQMVRFLDNKIKSFNESRDLYLIMLDLDYFKKINDKYGHVEGDNALVCVATALKKVGSRHNIFISRYGGDEFVIIYDTHKSFDILTLCQEIKDTVKNENRRLNSKYELNVSIGYAKYDESITSISDFIDAADKVLYNVKRTRE